VALPQDKLLLAAAGTLLLAFEEPGTISSMAHGIGHGAEGVTHGAEEAFHHEHGKIIQLHVKTPAGEVFYHLPIGSLIVKHPYKVHGKHSKLVQAGEHAFAVPKQAKVLVPKDTDLTDEKAVRDAAKHVVLKSAEGAERHAHISPHSGKVTDSGKLGAFENQEVHQVLHEDWKELPEGKKPVAFNGKIGAWVPHEWDVHKPANASEAQIGSKWAKDPDGHWHLIDKNGQIISAAKNDAYGNKYVADGKLVPEHEVQEPGPAHVEPKPDQEAPAAGKVIIINGVTRGHHCRSFQSAQKSQSPTVSATWR